MKQGVVSSRRYLADRLLGDVLVTPQVGLVAALPRMKTCPGWISVTKTEGADEERDVA